MSNVYAYEVTASNVDDPKVGTCLIDTEVESEPIRTWRFWNSRTGDFDSGFTGVRRERMCGVCWNDQECRVVLDGHEGPHGTAKPYEPAWITPAPA